MLAKDLQPAKAQNPILALQFFQPRIVMLAKELQPSKAELPISVTESGSVMLVKELQLSILVTESGILMLAKELQPAKAQPPISVTESGILMPSKDLQPAKAQLRIPVTPGYKQETIFSRMFSLHAVKTSLKISSLVCNLVGGDTESGILMLVKEVQPSKALLPISVTESGILMVAKELQPSKAELRILVTESGMATFTIFVQSLKAALETFVTVWGIFTWQKSCLQTAPLVAASISFGLYMTVMSDSACNAASLSVWASFSKQLPCKTSGQQDCQETSQGASASAVARFQSL